MNVTVGTDAIRVAGANKRRQRIIFTNNGANDIFVAPGPVISTTGGIPVKASGGVVVDEPDIYGWIYTGEWVAISGVAAQTLGVYEQDHERDPYGP